MEKRNKDGRLGKHLSEETKRKISISSMGKLLTYGHLGKHHTLEAKNKISNSRKGLMLSEKNHMWKGDDVGYFALHKWIQRKLGSPKICSKCGENNLNKRYEWHNISGKYKRDITDWKRLCVKCHRIYHKIELVDFEIKQKIKDMIINNPGINMRDLSKKVRLGKETIYRNLKEMPEIKLEKLNNIRGQPTSFQLNH